MYLIKYIFILLNLAIFVFLELSLYFYNPFYENILVLSFPSIQKNSIIGVIGSNFGGFSFYFLGLVAYLFPLFFLFNILNILYIKLNFIKILLMFYIWLLILIMISLILSLYDFNFKIWNLYFYGGGSIGSSISNILIKYIGYYGISVLIIFTFFYIFIFLNNIFKN